MRLILGGKLSLNEFSDNSVDNYFNFDMYLSQVSFTLGIVPIFVAWIYSEFLEYKRNSNSSKV